MEMVSKVNFKTLRSFQDHLGPFEAILGLFLVISGTQNEKNWPKMSQMSFGVILGPFWDHSRPICGPKFKTVADYSCDHSKRPQEEQNSDGDGFGSQFEPVEVFLGNFRVILGPFRDNFGPICGLELKIATD